METKKKKKKKKKKEKQALMCETITAQKRHIIARFL